MLRPFKLSGSKVYRQMKLRNTIIRLWLCGFIFPVLGQNDTALHLDAVEVSDRYFQRFSNHAFLQHLPDSVRTRQTSSLATFLSTQSLVHLRENSAGMVASASIRGGTAAQTSVLWNGIPINSLLTGQTDLGTVNAWDFSNIDVKSGGSSLFYGSGAISGTIHLQSDVVFNQETTARFLSRYGSFNSISNQALVTGGSSRFAYKISAQALSSTNNYPIPGRGKRMQNAHFTQQSMQFNLGWRLRESHSLSWHSYAVQAHRNLAVVPEVSMRSKLEDLQWRSLLMYRYKSSFMELHVKNAIVSERFDYFENRWETLATGSESRLYLQRWDAQKHFTLGTLSVLLEGQLQQAFGDQFDDKQRKIGTLGVFWQSKDLRKWDLQAGMRREWNSVQAAPWIGNVQLGYALSEFATVFTTASTHYRLPTFNDLFWPSSGNLDLKPEFSKQYEVGFSWQKQHYRWQTTFYHYNISHQIRWIPTPGGLWTPENVSKAENTGIETQFHYEFTLQKARLKTHFGYTYVNALDKIRNTRITFVPEHKSVASITYARKRWDAGLNGTFTSFVFTATDQSSFLPSFTLWNIFANFKIDKREKCLLNLNVYNLTNTFYETQMNRPMPGRNLHLGIQYQL